MIFVYNDRCSKCSELSKQLANQGFAWDTVRYMDGELSQDLVESIFEGYKGAFADLIREHEPEWKESGLNLDEADLSELKSFIMRHPIVLQRPIVLVEGRVIVARPPEVLWKILTETR